MTRRTTSENGSQPDPAPVLITGMHRTGTSMVAKALHMAGLYLGREPDHSRGGA